MCPVGTRGSVELGMGVNQKYTVAVGHDRVAQIIIPLVYAALPNQLVDLAG